MRNREFILEGLRSHSTKSELHRSSFWAECGPQIDSILSTPEVLVPAAVAPRLRSFVRVAQWNIEKGKRWREVIERLESDSLLKWADILLLNEADCGMLRSGNAHVAREVASALQMNMAFGPAHIELTKGTEDELGLAGDNRESLQGNAVLSRYPILEAKIVPLPVCFEPFEFHEKRYGARNCVWAKLKVGGGCAWVGAAHLEVRNTPRCRSLQMKHLVDNLPGSREDMYLVGGDLNTSGFARGTRLRTIQAIERLLFHNPDEVKEELRHPERRSEPLFRIAARAGFGWERLNSSEETASAPIDGLDEVDVLPEFIVRRVRRGLQPYRGYLSFKLDWLLGHGVRALGTGEILDASTGVAASAPGSVPMERTGPGRLSDHIPIFADLLLSRSE